MTSFHGSFPSCRRLFTTVLNNQKVMMSWPFARRDIGNIRTKNFSSSLNFNAIWGVKLLVAHVSMTSFSPTNSVPLHFPHLWPAFGWLAVGSTGNSVSSAKTASPTFAQYQIGKGTPKNRCRDTHQSHFKPFTQFSYLTFMCAGSQFSFAPAPRNFSFKSRYRMNHCLVATYSTSVSHRSCTFTACLMGCCFFNAPMAFKSSNTACRASLLVMPLYFPARSL